MLLNTFSKNLQIFKKARSDVFHQNFLDNVPYNHT